MNKRLFWRIAAIMLLMMALFGCSGATEPAPSEQPAEEAPAEEPAAAEEPAEEPAAAEEEEAAAEEPAAAEEEAAAEEPAEAEEPAAEEVDASGVTELTILWAQWDPADYLQEIANMYEAETGIKVNVVQEPWGSFQDLFFTEMSAQGT